MPTIERNIHLNVPVEVAYRYLSEPTHLPEFCPNVQEVGKTQRQSRGGVEFSWAFKMVGVRFEGMAELNETQHNRRLDMHVWGGIKGSVAWQVEPVGVGVVVTVSIDYELPAPILRGHSEATIIQSNEQIAECTLKNLKTLLEPNVTPAVVSSSS